jgi:succinyl-CoA synthetase beta subunit
MYNKTLVTKQTGEGGLKCKALYIVEKVEIKEEKYLSITLDRKTGGPIFFASAIGGVNIEETSEKNPEAIKFLPININKGLSDEVATEYAKSLGFTGTQVPQAKDIFQKLYQFFIEKDALMLEINPLAILKDDTVMVLDSKVLNIFNY